MSSLLVKPFFIGASTIGAGRSQIDYLAGQAVLYGATFSVAFMLGWKRQ
jgi:hypothetical protein